MTHVPMSHEELTERDDLLAEVNDPNFLRGGDLDADGEVEADEGGGEVDVLSGT